MNSIFSRDHFKMSLYNFSISIEHNEEKRSCRRKKSFKNDSAIDFLPKLKNDTHKMTLS